jgi:hypothetical protein
MHEYVRVAFAARDEAEAAQSACGARQALTLRKPPPRNPSRTRRMPASQRS